MEIVTLILGWLFGLLTTPITANIQRPRKRRELCSVLAREFRYLRGTMAIIAHRLGARVGSIDEEFLARIRPAVADLDEADEDRSSVAALMEDLALPPEQLRALGQLQAVPGHSPRVVAYHLPLLESQISHLGLLPGSVQERVIRIQHHLGLYNGQVEYTMTQFALTFDSSIVGDNHQAVVSNIETSYRALADRATTITQLITSVLGDLEDP